MQQDRQRGTVPALPPGESWEARNPARPASLVADVLVPLLQAGITGAFVASLVVFITARLEWDIDLAELWLGLALGSALLAWLLLLGQTRRLLWKIEERWGRDLDGDGLAGPPRERFVFVDRSRAREQAEEERELDEWATFEDFVERLPAKGTSLDQWERVLGRPLYNQYRNVLIEFGFARWRSVRPNGVPNKSQGWDLVKDPDEVLDSLTIEDIA